MAGYIGKSQGKILTNVEGNSVETADIQDSAVTETKIAAGSVTDTKLNSTKLDGIEAGATADQTGAEIKAAYEGEANTNAYTDAEKTKLAGIEAGATADQTGAEIKAAYEAEANTNAYTDAEKTKLAGIEAGADVTDTTNVTAAGALMDSEVTNLDQVKSFDSTDYATAAQGTKADSALQSSDIGVSIQAYSATLAGTTASFTTADETKLDGIEAGADVTDTANVTAAGALMDSEVTNLAQVKAFDSSDYATAAQGTLADSALQSSDIGTLVLSPTGDGSGLTGVESFTKSASNPTITTNGTLGDVWVNTTSGEIFVLTDATTDANVWKNAGNGSEDIEPDRSLTATGGTITTSGDYKYHKFTSSGTFAVSDVGNQTPTIEYLVVAGGGSGGPVGGGGGAGGVRTSSATATVNNYTVTVGAGGATKSYGSGGQANDGSSSSFNGLSCTGGGGGGGITTSGEYHGRSGGSGGGAGHSGAGRSGGSGTSGQGNSGGNNQAGSPYPTGGGGGKGSSGANGSGSSCGNGGSGYTWNSFITVGGGGGGGGGSYGGSAGSGGSGGGATGANSSGGTGGSGSANTGGGGGGGYYPAGSAGSGGSGGSGVVVIRYKFQNF